MKLCRYKVWVVVRTLEVERIRYDTICLSAPIS